IKAGRFGWKAQHPNLLQFDADAFLNETGITSPIFPSEVCPQGGCSLLACNPSRSHPEDADGSQVTRLTDFVRFLAAPPRGPVTGATARGEALFSQVGCSDCHTPSWKTGTHAIRTLNQVEFWPYSDFLLHDIGTLGDGIEQGDASPKEMRTPPLWG